MTAVVPVSSARVGRYSMLEGVMLELDDEGHTELADRLRDVMDVLWYQHLSDTDRKSLNQRDIPPQGTIDSLAIFFRPADPPTLQSITPVEMALPLTAHGGR